MSDTCSSLRWSHPRLQMISQDTMEDEQFL
jgi:hypothetical protein